MDIGLIQAAWFQVALVALPAITFAGFGGIRWDLRNKRTGSARIVRSLTVAMWGLVVLGAVVLVLGIRPVAVAVLWICLAVFLLRPRIGKRIARAPDPRRRASEAVRHVFELASSRFKPVDIEELRRELAALDEHVTPETFEFIHLARALMLHWLDGGSPTAANATRWQKRMTEIAAEWWPRTGGKAARDPRAWTRGIVTRWWLPIAFIGGAVLGAWIWDVDWPAPPEVTAGILVGYVFTWTDGLSVAAAGIVGAVVGLAASTGLQILECPSCDWVSTAATVTGLSVVGLLCAGSLVAWNRRSRPAPQLTVVAGPLEPDEARLPEQ